MTAPRFRLIEVERYEWPFRLRMPFRFGRVTVTGGRQAAIRVRIRLTDGRESHGVAAETLAAKWFDKNPQLSDTENEHQLRRALELACEATRAAGNHTAFGHFADTYVAHCQACAAEGLNPLIAAFGRAVLDRALLDALLKAEGVSFAAGMRANIGGLAPHPIIPDLADCDFAAFLAELTPLRRIAARHTVGLLDPLTAADHTTPCDDGLPETLEEVVATYRHRWWKLKVGGDVAADCERLRRIAAVLDQLPDYRVTLDGNEQYAEVEAVLALWHAIEADPALARLCQAIAYIEQPIARARALDSAVVALAEKRPVIIDESDGPLDAFLRAKTLGYCGVSSKACKGVWRSLINLARCQQWNGTRATPRYFLSGEDLTTLAGVCVQQDLALVALLGLSHVERNGHHFVDGFAGRPAVEAQRFLAAHSDLYHPTPYGPRLRISAGMLTLDTVVSAVGLGTSLEPLWEAMTAMPKAAWPPPGVAPVR